MTKRAAPIGLAGVDLGDVRHVCAFFRSDDEEYDVLLPFIKDGFDGGEKAIHVINAERHRDHLQRMLAAGIDTAGAEARGQLELRGDAETYLRGGRFDQERMLAEFEGWAGVGGDAGVPFSRSRMVCRMDFVSGDGVSVDDVLEFESRVNDVWRRHDDVVVCTYRMDQLGGEAVIDMMRTHPVVIIGGIMQRNPFFVPPEKFVPELRARRRGKSATVALTS